MHREGTTRSAATGTSPHRSTDAPRRKLPTKFSMRYKPLRVGGATAEAKPVLRAESGHDAVAAEQPARALPGSCVANGLRHGASAFDNAVVRPVFSAVRNRVTAPACDTIPVPVVSTDSDGYRPIELPTRKVHLDSREFGPQPTELSQVGAPFFLIDTTSHRISTKARG